MGFGFLQRRVRYILLSGKQPFYGTNNKEIFKQVHFFGGRRQELKVEALRQA